MDSLPKRHKPLIVQQTLRGDHEDDDNEDPMFEKTLGGDNGDGNTGDRISDLPDSLLCHILSKLPTKDAVATAFLSTKWKHLFASIPNLSIDIDDKVSNPTSNQPNPNFVNFMSHLLTVTLRDAICVREFALNCNHDHGNAHIDGWISAALGLNVTKLAIFFNAKNTGLSIASIFNSATLVDLSWSQNFPVNVPNSVCLRNLKRLLIDFVIFPDGYSFERVLDGCPVIEDLSLDSCYFKDIEILRICSHSLKLLMLKNCCLESVYEVEIDTPELELLLYDDDVAMYYPSRNLNSLVKAHVDVGPGAKLVDEADPFELLHYDENVADLVGACSNVTFLYLSGASVSAVRCSSRPMPTFHNLIILELGGLNSLGWEMLPKLLELAPNLEVLAFRGFFEHTGRFTKFQDSLPNQVPTCLLLHLRSIYFGEFNGEQDEIELVRYFLMNAEVLEKMEFSFRSSMPVEKKLSTWTKLMLLRRYSKKNCKIDLAHEDTVNIVNFCHKDGSSKLTLEYVREHEMEITRNGHVGRLNPL